MKIKDCISNISEFVFFSVIFIIFLPFCLIYLLFNLLATPFDYIKYKRSLYQQDFPQKYKWLSGPHADNEVYTIIKENNLPIDYIKWREDYDLNGYFLYKDILLNFTEPLFFDKKRGLWLFWPSENGADEIAENDKSSEDIDYDNTDDCLTVEATKEFIIEQFRNNITGRECNQVVFFYKRKNVESNYEEGGLDAMRKLDDFIIYEKGDLEKSIIDYIEHN